MENPICNTVFDSRDLIEYRDSLAEELIFGWNDYRSEVDEEFEEATEIGEVDLNLEGFRNRFEEEVEHYEEIFKFCDELSDFPDFEYGETIIHSDYFEDYCREQLGESGYISKDFPTWIEIDWKSTSENMKQDYTFVEYEGEDYYIRNC